MKPFFSASQKIIAHRGGVPGMPDCHHDTLSRAIELGTDIIFIKVLCTKDNEVLVCQHDEINNNSSHTKLSELKLEEVRVLNQGEKSHNDSSSEQKGSLPYYKLHEILETFLHQRFIVEFNDKRNECIKAFCKIIESANAQERVLIYSLFEKPLKRIGKILPQIAKALSLYGVLGVYALFRAGLLYFKRSFKSDAILVPETIGMSYIGNSGFIRECRSKGMRVYVYTENTRQQIERLYDIGINGFITRDVATAKKILQELDTEKPQND